tara:strand:- start:1129 stop:1308 length:180 start_codon:yes stop_codon:yes gene_type:complete
MIKNYNYKKITTVERNKYNFHLVLRLKDYWKERGYDFKGYTYNGEIHTNMLNGLPPKNK